MKQQIAQIRPSCPKLLVSVSPSFKTSSPSDALLFRLALFQGRGRDGMGDGVGSWPGPAQASSELTVCGRSIPVPVARFWLISPMARGPKENDDSLIRLWRYERTKAF